VDEAPRPESRNLTFRVGERTGGKKHANPILVTRRAGPRRRGRAHASPELLFEARQSGACDGAEMKTNARRRCANMGAEVVVGNLLDLDFDA